MPVSPSMRRRRLAAELRRLRDQSSLSIADVADNLNWQESRLSRIETRQLGISATDLRKLLDLYGVKDRAHQNELLELARRGNERGWWQVYGSRVVPNEYANLIVLEEEAATIRTYEPELVPGLLQTPDYARAVIRAFRPTDTTEEIDRRVEVRLERQEILDRDNPPPPQIHVVLNEGVLARRVGGAKVIRGQLEYLMQERDRANVVVQVLPQTAGEHPGMVGPFTMLTFLDPGDHGVVNVENAMGALFLEKPEDLRTYEEIWNAVLAKALSPADSRAFLKTYSLR
ncbi:MAG: helix-turn-helix domain-containing protein [Streptosporangiales bacterium]|nr:helix-turn-helix domain-containing protein [Streptosporangiales bacterium]